MTIQEMIDWRMGRMQFALQTAKKFRTEYGSVGGRIPARYWIKVAKDHRRAAWRMIWKGDI